MIQWVGHRAITFASFATWIAVSRPAQEKPPLLIVPPNAPPVTWSSRIAELVRLRCVGCHREGGAGPFKLVTPEDFAGARTMIRAVVADGQMPPWFATPASVPFKNDISLRPDERADLLRWLDDSCPIGESAHSIAPEPAASSWQIGEPDLVVTIPLPVKIPATGVLDYVTREVPTKLDHDVWVSAIEIRPQHPEICHHALAHAIYPEDKTAEFIDSYLPGGRATIYPKEVGFKLEMGAFIRFQLHYTPNGTPLQEQTQIGFKFATEPPAWRVAGQIVRSHQRLRIEPGDPDFVVSAEHLVTADVRLRRVLSHMHLRGKASKIEVVKRDGSITTALEIERWHPEWQFCYELTEPIVLERGDKVHVTSRFDNSRNNPFNPDPRAVVTAGAQIWNEMDGAFVEWMMPADRPYQRHPDVLAEFLDRARKGLPRKPRERARGASEKEDDANQADATDDDGGESP
ncbi:MAG: cytochrome c [Planctomycetes bacterium]|nr:cytochrome c [Planctomycetota bacterium]